MLNDPENFEEWSETIRAADMDAAKVRCQRMAERIGLTEVINVSQETKTRSYGTYRFVCWFRSEVTDNDGDSSEGSGAEGA